MKLNNLNDINTKVCITKTFLRLCRCFHCGIWASKSDIIRVVCFCSRIQNREFKTIDLFWWILTFEWVQFEIIDMPFYLKFWKILHNISAWIRGGAAGACAPPEMSDSSTKHSNVPLRNFEDYLEISFFKQKCPPGIRNFIQALYLKGFQKYSKSKMKHLNLNTL